MVTSTATTALRAARRPHVCRSCARKLLAARRAHSSARADIYDVVVVGGGPAGLSLVTALKSSPQTSSLRLAVIDAQDLGAAATWAPSEGTFSNRASSLTPASRHFLEHIGAWAHLDAARVQPYERMHVWDGVSDARIRFDWPAHQHTQPAIAYMTENPALLRALLARLKELPGVDVLDRARVAGIELPEGSNSSAAGTATAENSNNPDTAEEHQQPDLSLWPHVRLETGQTLAARLLVGADGANSPVRTFAGIAARGWDYGRMGVVATLELAEAAPLPTAFQRFLPTGPLAMLPLPGRRASLVWSTTPERAAALRALPPAGFAAMVNAGFRLRPVDLAHMHTLTDADQIADELAWRLQHTPVAGRDAVELPARVAAVQPGSVAAFPLRMRHADTYATHRVALVGDAAHSVHPLAGQGLNLGLADAGALAEAIAFAVAHGMDVGDQLSLEAYTSDRYAANNALLGVTDKLHKLYSVESGPLVALRSVGLRAVDAAWPLKEFFMRQAAG